MDNTPVGSPAPISSHSSQAQEKPLLEWLLKSYPDTPKTRAKQWIVSRRVTVNGVVISKPHQLIPDPGNTLKLSDRHANTLDLGSGWIIHPRVTLLYLDSAFAIVNKGPGVLSVPASNSALSALSILGDFLVGNLKPRDPSVAGKTLPPAYRHLELMPVHRIDQYTSGVFCIATSPASRQHLIEQLKAHTMKREYVAFVEGRSRASAGTWRQWLQLSRDEMTQHVISEAQAKDPRSGALEAITHYEVLAEYPLKGGKGVITKLKLRLETGRKHQIRLQAAHAGLPLVGDRTYNPGCRPEGLKNALLEFPRQALHAERLTLEHPFRPGTRMSWPAEMPKDLRQLEGALISGQL